MRLRISGFRLPEKAPGILASIGNEERSDPLERHFAYVSKDAFRYQKEMERIFTLHLERLGARLSGPGKLLEPGYMEEDFPVEATVVIPVRNREKTILDSVGSALSQVTDFSYNVIVVENHSDDETRNALGTVKDGRLVVITPKEKGHGIGGCWNEAIFSKACGRFVVQLDSDDLYAGKDVLQVMVHTLKSGPYAMAVGSYRVVDFNLNEIPPGIVDHREWTDENGRNNLLRVQGIGAPRGFCTSLLRRVRFPDVSYGEDYAVSLAVSREYRIARIWEPIYLCRRWEGNSDAAPAPEEVARRNDFKDRTRSEEILLRRKLVGSCG